MSGIHETIIRVSRQQIQQAISQARRQQTDYLEQQLAHQKAQARRREQELTNRLEEQHRRGVEYDKRLSKLNEGLQQARQQHCQEINRMQQQFQKDVSGLNSRMDGLDQRLDQQHQELLNRLQDHANHFQKELDIHGQQLDQLHQRITHQEATATGWTDALSDELAFIQNHYRHHLFAPGELDALHAELATAKNDIRNNFSEAALTLARQAFSKACQLRDRLEYQESLWNTLYPAAQEAVSNACQSISAHRDVPVELAPGQDEPASLDIDYWTWGARQELEDELNKMMEQLAHAPDTIGLERLQQMIDRAGQIPGILEDLYQKSLARMIASVRRNDIQDQIREKLANWGYQIVEATLQGETGEDFRGAHYMKLKNSLGDEIVTSVEPLANESGEENRIRFNFYDKTPNESLRTERINTIGDTLKNEGLDVSRPTCVPEYRHKNAPDDLRDFNRVRKPVTPPQKQRA